MSETSEAAMGTIAGPGRRLAEARNAQGLALEHVSGQLRLSLQILRALEADDYAHLPPAAFVTGYLRSYARLLGLPEQEIIDDFAAAGRAPQVKARGQRRQVRASDPPVRALTYLIFGSLLLLSALWWVSQNETPQAVAPAAPQTIADTQQMAAEEGVDSPAQPGQAEAVQAPSGEVATLPSDPAPGDAGAMPVSTAGPQSGTLPAAAAPAVANELPAQTQPAASPTAAPVPTAVAPAPTAVAPAPAPAAPEAPPAPPLTAEMPQSKLVLELTGESWAEITDAVGRKLAYGMVQGGTLTLRGEAPFKVFFGYAPAVQVSLNGEAFDHRPYQRRNDTARFRLGNTGDNTLRTD